MRRTPAQMNSLARRLDRPLQDSAKALRLAESKLTPPASHQELVRNARRILNGEGVEDQHDRRIERRSWAVDRESTINLRRSWSAR